MTDSRLRISLRSGLLIFLVSCLAVPAIQAQQSGNGADDGAIEEIIVTARKRQESLQDVPFSIDAKTEDQLRSMGATSMEDIAHNVAGFTVQNLGPGQSQVAMRGISAGQIVRDQPGVKEQVGVYFDESVISLSLFTPDLDLFDMNRVEVLRGPQGTLFGSGSIAGTVRYISNQPNLQTFDLVAEGSGNLLDDAGTGGSLKAAMNFPIIEDKLGLRVAGYVTRFGGFIDAVQPTGGAHFDVNNGGRLGVRAAFRVEPVDRVTITPRVIFQKVDYDGFNREDDFNILANPFTTTRPARTLGDREQFTQLEEEFTDEFLLADAVVEIDFGSAVLTSVTSYTDREVLQIRDATQLTASITAQPTILNQTEESVFAIDAPLFDATDAQVFTQELRVASTGEGDFQWVAGGFYSEIDRRYGQTLDVAGFEDAFNAIPGQSISTALILAGKDILFFSDIPYDFNQFAIFGEATYTIADQLHVTAGIRWFDFEETRILNFDGIFADQTIGLRGRTKSDGFSPRVMLSWEVNDSIRLNAQASKGFRLGGINDPLNAPICSPEDLATFGGRDSFDDEELWTYEVGAKTSLLGGRATVNVAAFYSDIDDLQATLEAGTCSSRIVFNVPKARSLGVELDLVAQPLDGLDFGVSASYTDSELRSTVTSTDSGGATTVVGGIEKGNRLPTVPRFQLSAHATYTRQLANGWEGFLTGTFQHVGSRFTQIGDQSPSFGTVDLTVTPIGNPSISTFTFDPKLPAYQIGNLRLGIRADQWELAFFINNLWDERAHLALDRERGSRARVGFLTNQPRTFGLVARVAIDNFSF